MHLFEIAIEILDNILDEHIPFNLATKNILDKYSIPQDERINPIGLVGCELRHHLLFDVIVKDNIQLEEGVSNSAILLLLANHHFYFKFDAQEALAIASRVTNLDKKVLEAFLKSQPDKNALIPDRYEKGSFEYLSLRYNCPVWLVKMLTKHFGRGLAFKILQVNTRPMVQAYKLNGIALDRVLLDSNFAAAPVDDMVFYVGKGNAKSTQFYKKKEIFYEKIPFKMSLDQVNVKPNSSVAIYGGYSNTLYLDLALRAKDANIQLIVPDITLATEARRHMSIYGLKNVSLMEEKAANLLACISDKVDYFFMLARNSNFELLRSNADYFLRFSRDDLDSIMNEQRYSLEEAASLIKEGGELIYMIPTLNKKESRQIITEFLLIHREFSLLEDRQYFPFEEYGSTLYVARMIKAK